MIIQCWWGQMHFWNRPPRHPRTPSSKQKFTKYGLGSVCVKVIICQNLGWTNVTLVDVNLSQIREMQKFWVTSCVALLVIKPGERNWNCLGGEHSSWQVFIGECGSLSSVIGPEGLWCVSLTQDSLNLRIETSTSGIGLFSPSTPLSPQKREIERDVKNSGKSPDTNAGIKDRNSKATSLTVYWKIIFQRTQWFYFLCQ